MDVLTDILESLEMHGSLYFATEFREPWSVLVPSDATVCRFHVVVQGRCRVTVPETGDICEMSKGDLVLVPHGASHWLQCPALEEPKPLPEILEKVDLTPEGCLQFGEGQTVTRMVCGYFAFDPETRDAMLESLPGLIHVEATSSYEFGWIENALRFIGQEAGSGRPGSTAISRRLSEILFILAIRHYASKSPERIPILSAAMHPNLGAAMMAMHSAPSESWTVEALAQEAALSRTAFSQKFRELVGVPPMQYLTGLRMRRARKLLRREESVSSVAHEVGYGSEAAFNRAFKRAFGIGPGAFRRHHATAV